MSVSSFPARMVSVSLVLLAVAAVGAQAATLQTNGTEYLIAGKVPGAQLHPQLAINGSGGFLAWEDNATDGRGSGVSAIALDGSFHKIGAPFRINQTANYDQERVRAALLKNGGAVFAWQGGRQGFQRVFARFLTASNTWAGGEIQLNPAAKGFQIKPSVAVLNNGNVVITWAAFTGTTNKTLQDVYAQLFTPGGQPIGSAFVVNQTLLYNQRTPDVVPLGNGGFVIAWVSEMQRSGASDTGDEVSFQFSPAASLLPSVDIYARSYSEAGVPSSDEFPVNTSSDVCANPSLAASASGGYIVTWSQRDPRNIVDRWDIYSRVYSAAGDAGPSRMVNSHVRGDQYVPHAASAGNNFLVVWTSFGQDGSWEGVFGQYLNAEGSPIGVELRVNTSTRSQQIQPTVAADPAGRFLAVWSSIVGGLSAFDLFAQQYVSSDFNGNGGGLPNIYGAPPAETFNDGPIPPDSTGGGGVNSGGSGKSLEYPVAVTGSGNVLPNAFAQAKGTYNGLFSDANGVAGTSLGYVSATVDARGGFSARFSMRGKTYSAAGKFDSLGNATVWVTRSGFSKLKVDLTIDLSGADQLRGKVTDGVWTADLIADRVIYTKASGAPAAGSYTFVIPADASSGNAPQGDGVATLTVDGLGNVQLTGTLADGTKISQKTGLSKQGVWPLYVSLYGGQGSLAGWVQFSSTSTSDLSGQVVWLRPSGLSGSAYSGGFTNAVTALGSKYHKPSGQVRVMSLSSGSATLSFSGAGLAPFSNDFTVASNNKVTVAAGHKLTLSLTTTTGAFRGTFSDPSTGKALSFQGVLFEKAHSGFGYFLRGGQSGEVNWSSNP